MVQDPSLAWVVVDTSEPYFPSSETFVGASDSYFFARIRPRKTRIINYTDRSTIKLTLPLPHLVPATAACKRERQLPRCRHHRRLHMSCEGHEIDRNSWHERYRSKNPQHGQASWRSFRACLMAEVGCSYSISIGLFVCFFLSRKSTLSKLVDAFEFSFESTVGNQSQYFNWLLMVWNVGTSSFNVFAKFDTKCIYFSKPGFTYFTKSLSHQQARNQLGTPGGTKNFPRGANIFWTMSSIFKLCPTHFSRGEAKLF